MLWLNSRTNNRWISLHAMHMTSLKLVKVVLLLVKRADLDPEEDATNEGDDSHGSVVPHKQWVSTEWVEGLADGGRDGRHEEEEGHDERTHVLWCLGESIFESSNASEDLRD